VDVIGPIGCVYTPDDLARRLARIALARLPRHERPTVCDPACGDGSLLAAVQRLRPDAELFGLDLDADALQLARQRLGPDATLVQGDALGRRWLEGPFGVVVANPPWVSYSGRQAQPITGDRRSELRERYRLFRSWPALHSAFVELSVRLARDRIALLLPAQVCDLERYGPVRSFLRTHGRIVEPALPLGEDAFEGVVQPSCLLTIDRRGVSKSLADEPIPLTDHAAGYPALLDRLARPPAAMFTDIGVHTGNCARRLVGEVGEPIREGRDVRPYELGEPRRRFRFDYEPAGEEYFRAASLAAYRDIPILLRQTADRPMAALHRAPAYFRNSVLACRGLAGVDDALVVAWLNNSLTARYHRATVRESGQRSFPQLKVRHLRELPMPDFATAPKKLVELARAVAKRGRVEQADALDAAFVRWVRGG
jgi:SAM-dependent methyltransferase